MKKNLKLVAFSAILLMLAGSFFSCGEKEKPFEPFLTVDETPITIEKAEAGVYSIVVNSNCEWTAVVENAEWCTLDKNSGSGDAVITVNVAENTIETPRSATIKITAGSLTKSVVINQNAAEGYVPYECPNEKDGYLDTISMEGVGYLFVNAIPAGLQKEDNIMYIIYNKEDNSTTFSARYTIESAIMYLGNYNGSICNFPCFAKEWEVPTEGKQIYYKGELYVTGIYWSEPPYIGGDLVLTTLEEKEML